jgi:hypothetical protein
MQRYTNFIEFYTFLESDFSTLIENVIIFNFFKPFVCKIVK